MKDVGKGWAWKSSISTRKKVQDSRYYVLFNSTCLSRWKWAAAESVMASLPPTVMCSESQVFIQHKTNSPFISRRKTAVKISQLYVGLPWMSFISDALRATPCRKPLIHFQWRRFKLNIFRRFYVLRLFEVKRTYTLCWSSLFGGT